MKNKTLEALLRGYIFFDVNGQRYWTYRAALAARKAVPETLEVCFAGRHLFKGWVIFFRRIERLWIYEATL